MNNLFHNLSKYKLQGGRNPLEDFLTEAFAILLNHNKPMINHLLAEIVKSSRHDIVSKIRRDNYYVETQKYLDPNNRVDMVIRGKENCFYFENKIEADSEQEQINNYRIHWNTEQEGNGNNGGVVLLTKYIVRTDSKINPHYKFLWANVYLLLKKYLEQYKNDKKVLTGVNKFLLDQFIEFLEENDMGLEPIKIDFENAIKERWKVIKLIPSVMKYLENSYAKKNKSTTGHDWCGYYFGQEKESEYFFGVLDNTGSLALEIYENDNEKKRYLLETLKEEDKKWYGRNDYIAYNFDSKKYPKFNSKNVKSQIECLADFVEDRLECFKKIYNRQY